MATLKISDLSVGDWVRYDDRICQIAEICHLTYNIGSKKITITPSVTLFYEDDMPTYQESVILNDIHPIPITAEILETNGFEKGHRGCFYHYLRLDKNRTLYIHASTNGWRVEITYDAAGILRTTHLMPDMNSVHDIQHALRLAGVDKEINL